MKSRCQSMNGGMCRHQLEEEDEEEMIFEFDRELIGLPLESMNCATCTSGTGGCGTPTCTSPELLQRPCNPVALVLEEEQTTAEDDSDDLDTEEEDKDMDLIAPVGFSPSSHSSSSSITRKKKRKFQFFASGPIQEESAVRRVRPRPRRSKSLMMFSSNGNTKKDQENIQDNPMNRHQPIKRSASIAIPFQKLLNKSTRDKKKAITSASHQQQQQQLCSSWHQTSGFESAYSSTTTISSSSSSTCRTQSLELSSGLLLHQQFQELVLHNTKATASAKNQPSSSSSS